MDTRATGALVTHRLCGATFRIVFASHYRPLASI
jgi:hypothetical protein